MIGEFSQLGIVIYIISVAKKVYFIEEMLDTVHYDEHFHAYAVKYSFPKRIACVALDSMKDHVPLQFHLITYEDAQHMFVALRHVMI